MTRELTSGQVLNFEYDDHFGAVIGSVLCLKCNKEVCVDGRNRNECQCGYDWSIVVDAVGIREVDGDCAEGDGQITNQDISKELKEVVEIFVEAWEDTWVDPDDVSLGWYNVYQRAKEVLKQGEPDDQ